MRLKKTLLLIDCEGHQAPTTSPSTMSNYFTVPWDQLPSMDPKVSSAVQSCISAVQLITILALLIPKGTTHCQTRLLHTHLAEMPLNLNNGSLCLFFLSF
jgi:hypothetical protein